MQSDDPIAYFLTWTVYGTFLPGDQRWWHDRKLGERPPQPRLEQWHRERLKHNILLLNDEHRRIVENSVVQHCQHRDWKLWAVNARSNHVHVILTAREIESKTVLNQLKANCTRSLRENFSVFEDRPVWTVGGDRKSIFREDELENVVGYIESAQDRKWRDSL